MFELYAQNVKPDNVDFQAFIERYVATKDSRKPDLVPYSELYKVIREGIREYIQSTQQSKTKPKK